MPPLTTRQRATLQSASRGAIKKTLEDMHGYATTGQWVSPKNSYRHNCVKLLRAHLTTPGKRITNSHLRHYIAASAPLHCADGWSYLGRALDSHSHGDRDAARHFAYYGELRAAMSLLAAEGIGIFHEKHFVVTDKGRCERIHRDVGTHVIAWKALEEWATLGNSADLLKEIILPDGTPMGTWLSQFLTVPVLAHTAKKWLTRWGFDLERPAEDRDSRNEASYRPTRINQRKPLDRLSSAEFLRELWSLFEPTIASRFQKLDQHLFRLALDETFKEATGRSPRASPRRFKDNVIQMLQRMNLGDKTREERWEEFLLRRVGSDAEDAWIIKEAQKTDEAKHPRHHLQVISRAALLLRVATGACSRLLRECGYSRNDLRFWWSDLGEERGLFAPTSEPTHFTDLFEDIRQAIVEIERWEKDKPSDCLSTARLQREYSSHISIMATCERIALWGLVT